MDDQFAIDAESPAQTLVRYLERNGCLRRPNPERRESERELAFLRRTMRDTGLKPGKPFAKVKRWVQPVYGRIAMETFFEWVELYGDTTDGGKCDTNKREVSERGS